MSRNWRCTWRFGPCADGTKAGTRCREEVLGLTDRCQKHTFPVQPASFRCPTNPLHNSEPLVIVGCGATFEAVPDDEGLVDCPMCGIWFDPTHPASQPQPAGAVASSILAARA